MKGIELNIRNIAKKLKSLLRRSHQLAKKSRSLSIIETVIGSLLICLLETINVLLP